MKHFFTILTLTLFVNAFSQVPTITSVTPKLGVVGSTVVLTGTNFNSTASSNTVYFGAAKATVIASSATSCSVAVPSGASFGPVTLTNAGNTAYSKTFFNPVQNCPDDISIASFDTTSFATAFGNSYNAAFGDFDLDGKIDMALTEKPFVTVSYVSIYKNTSTSGGAITFASTGIYTVAVGGNVRGIAAGDLNGDGKLDLACLDRFGGKVSVLINNSTTGNLNFNIPVQYLVSNNSGGEGIAIGDLNKDGKPDIAVTTGSSGTNDSLAILQNQNAAPGASFTPTSFAHYTAYYAGDNLVGIAIGDIDGDSFEDIVVSPNNGGVMSIFKNNSSAGSTISFDARQNFSCGTTPGLFFLSLGDLNGDDNLDIAVAQNGQNAIRVFENNSSVGSFSLTSDAFQLGTNSGNRDAVIGDINGDGKLDFIGTSHTANRLLAFSNISGSGAINNTSFFAAADTFNLPYTNTAAKNVYIVDLNADGKMDLVSTRASSAGNDRLTIFKSTVNGGPYMTSASSTTICSGNAVGLTFSASASPVTYTWKTSNNASCSGESTTNQTVSTLTNVLTTFSFVTTPLSLTYTVTPSSSLCPTGTPHPQLVNVTVNPKPVISFNHDTICSGSTFLANITAANVIPVGTSYSWPAPTQASGMTGGAAGTSTTNTISGTLSTTASVSQNAVYSIVPTSYGCVGATFSLNVTVQPKASIPSTSLTVCSGSTFSATLGGTIPAGTTYSWSAPAVTGSITGGTAASSATNVTGVLTNPTSVNQTAIYTITPKSGLCSGTPFTLTVTVKPKPNISAINFPLTICTGTSFTLMPTGTLPVGTTYSWALPTVTGGMTGGAVGTNASTIVGALTNTTATNQNATYTITPTANACVGAPFSVVVPINPKPIIAANSATVCTGTSFVLNPTGTIPAGTMYSWGVPTVTGGMTGAAAGSNSPNLTGLLTNPSAFWQKAVYTVTPNSGSCIGSLFNFSVTVNPSATILPSTRTICTGDPISAFTGTIPAGTTYSWPLPVGSASITGGTASSGANSLTDILANTTAISQSVIYTVTPLSGSCLGSVFTTTVTVNPKPAIAAASSTVCTGITFSATPSGTIPAGTTYSWGLPTVTGGMTGAVTGTNTSVIIGTLTNTTSTSQSASYIISPSAGSCLGSTFVYSVTVNPKALIAASTATVCSGNTFTFTPSGTIPVGTTYSWALPTVTGGMIGASTGSNTSVIAGSLTNSTALSQTAIYTITPTSGSCSGLPFTLTVTVNPKPIIAATSATVCTGITFTASQIGTIPVGTTYSWPLPTATGMTGGATGTNASLITGLLTNTAITSKVAIYTITPTAGSCSGSAFTLSVTVNPKPTMTSVSSKTICSGTSVGLNLTSSVTSTYSWIAADNIYTSGESIAPVNSATINDIVSTTNTATQTVVYYVTPTSSIGSCIGNTQTVSVKIDYIPNANAGLDQTLVCSSSTGLNANAVSAPNVGTWSSPVSPFAGFVPNVNQYNASANSIITNPATTYTLVWTISNGGGFCPDKSDTVLLFADSNNPLCVPTASFSYGNAGVGSGVDDVSFSKICVNSPVNFYDLSISATSYKWDFGDGSPINTTQNPTHTYTLQGSYICKLSINNGTVNPSPLVKQYTISVIGAPNTPTVISGVFTGICAGSSVLPYSTSLIPNATQYNWTVPSGATIITPSPDFSSFNLVYSNAALDGIMTVYASNGCGSSGNYSQPIQVLEVPAAAGVISEIGGNTTFCQGVTGVTFTVPVIAGATSYVWDFNGISAISSQTTTGNSVTVNISPTAVSNTISVFGVNSCTTGLSSSLSITINPSPEPVFSIAGSSAVCTGVSTLYNASSTLSTGIVWSFLPVGSATTSDNTTIGNITFNTTGTTTITATHQNSCGFGVSASYTVLVSSLPPAAGPIIGTTAVCQNQSSVTFSVPLIPSATSYSWTTPIGATTTSGFNTNSITTDWTNTGGIISVYAVNGCGNGSPAVNYSVVVNPLPVVTAIASNSVICLNGNVTLNGGGANTYTWTPSSVINNAAFTPSVSSSYTVTGTDINGCENTETVSVVVIAPLVPSICMVTVDSMSNNNIIYWDNTGYTSTDSFYVYRDIANNNYALIGKQPNTSVQFTDTVRALYTANGDPNASSWRYKIAVKDSCGNISDLSPFHQTIFIQQNAANFNWSPYQIEGQAVPVPALTNYLVYRDDLATNAWNNIQTMSASSGLYTDANYTLYPSGRYRVETQWSITCGGVAQKVNAVSKSRSNVKNNNFVITDINSSSIGEFVIMPNPAKDFVEVHFDKGIEHITVEVFDMLGKIVAFGENNNSEDKIVINTVYLPNGFYTLRLKGNNQLLTKKLIIEK